MNSESNIYVPYFRAYLIFYTLFASTLQFFLLYLITRKSPATLDHLKYFLYNTSFVQLFMITMAFFVQQRVLPNSSDLAVLAMGPCTFLGPKYCFIGYHVYTSISEAAALGISNTVVFRYLVLIKDSISENQIFTMIAVSYIPSIILLILPFTSEWNFEKVQNSTYKQHPTYDLSIYEPFPGFADISNFQFLGATGLLAVGVYGIPTCCFILTRRVLSLIKYHQNMSEKTKKQAQTLINGLTVQTILPVLAYIPTFTCYIITQTYGMEILISEHLILVSASSPSLLDPLISFYFIVPYRTAIIQIFSRSDRKPTSTVVSVSANQSVV